MDTGLKAVAAIILVVCFVAGLGHCGRGEDLNPEEKLKIVVEETETSNQTSTILHCTFVSSNPNLERCSSIWWSRVTAVDHGNVTSSLDVQFEVISGSEASYRVQEEVAKLTSHLEILNRDEILNGRYLCSVACGSLIYNTSCAFIRDETKNDTHVWLEEDSVHYVHEMEKVQPSAVPERTTTLTSHDTQGGKGSSTSKESSNGPSQSVYLAISAASAVAFFLVLLMLLRWYVKRRMTAKRIHEFRCAFIRQQSQDSQRSNDRQDHEQEHQPELAPPHQHEQSSTQRSAQSAQSRHRLPPDHCSSVVTESEPMRRSPQCQFASSSSRSRHQPLTRTPPSRVYRTPTFASGNLQRGSFAHPNRNNRTNSPCRISWGNSARHSRSNSPARPRANSPARPRSNSPARPRSNSPARPRSNSPARPRANSRPNSPATPNRVRPPRITVRSAAQITHAQARHLLSLMSGPRDGGGLEGPVITQLPDGSHILRLPTLKLPSYEDAVAEAEREKERASRQTEESVQREDRHQQEQQYQQQQQQQHHGHQQLPQSENHSQRQQQYNHQRVSQQENQNPFLQGHNGQEVLGATASRASLGAPLYRRAAAGYQDFNFLSPDMIFTQNRCQQRQALMLSHSPPPPYRSSNQLCPEENDTESTSRLPQTMSTASGLSYFSSPPSYHSALESVGNGSSSYANSSSSASSDEESSESDDASSDENHPSVTVLESDSLLSGHTLPWRRTDADHFDVDTEAEERRRFLTGSREQEPEVDRRRFLHWSMGRPPPVYEL